MAEEQWKRLKEGSFVSVILVAVNVIVFLICTFTGDLLYNGGRLSPDTFFEQREYYRLITAMFLHTGIHHLVNNMLILFGLGAMIEKEIGHFRFGCLYFISGIGGQILSLVSKISAGEWYVGSVGASGAVFGLVGVLLAIVLFTGMKMSNITPARVIFVVIFSIYSGLGTAGIDNAAHIGGCAVGFLAGMCLCLIERWKGNVRYTRKWQGDGYED